MNTATKSRTPVTSEELREAERGLTRLLYARRFPGEWIERHVPDLMAQAYADLAGRIAKGREDENVNLLVVIGYRKATKLVDRQRRHPADTSIEKFSHLADDFTPTPEEEAIHHDRQERVMAAIGQLPDRERKLLSLVYFEDQSIREAGRRVGLGKSSADRHHRAALERLEELLDRSLLAPELAIPAYIAAGHPSAPVGTLSWIGGVAETLYEKSLSVTGRLAPLGEPGSAAAVSGGGRTLATAGACGVAALACLAGATGGAVVPAIEPTPHASHPQSANAVRSWPEREVGKDFIVPEQTRAPEAHGTNPEVDRGSEGGESPRTGLRNRGRSDRPMRSESAAPPATARETVEEMGVESGEAHSGGLAEGSEAVQNAPVTSETSGTRVSGGDASSSPGHPKASEFGM